MNISIPRIVLVQVVAVLLLCGIVNAIVYEFKDQSFPTGQYFLLRTGMIVPSDAPALFSTRKTTDIKFDLDFELDQRTTSVKREILEIAVFHADDLPFIGSHLTSSLKDNIALCVNGSFFIGETHNRIFRARKILDPRDSENDSWQITKSGIYYLIMINCDTSSGATMIIDGKVQFRNPYGHLDAEEFGFLPFFAALTVAYIVVGLIWGILSVINLKDLLKLQLLITLVFLISLLENAFYYFHYQYINNRGVRSPFIFTLATTTSLGRRTVARLLVLIVCMGYSIIKETLGSKHFLIVVYGFSYFSVSCIAEVVNIMYYKMHKLSPLTASILTLPSLVVDALYYVWLLYEMRGILRQLSIRKQTQKLILYNRFKWLLIFYVGCALIWSIYENYLQLQGRKEHDKRWETNWTTNAFWYILYLVILVLTMILWNPRSTNKRFAHSQEYAPVETEDVTEEEKENLVEMKSISINDASDDEDEAKTQKQQVQQPKAIKEATAPKEKKKKKKKNPLSGFSLNDDDKEGEEDIVDKIE